LKELTTTETTRLTELEQVVQRGQQTFIEVGNALAEIRDSKLYRQTHKTFEAYCKEKWDWTRMQASRLIRAADTAENVTHGLQKPTSERQIRPLTGDYLTSDEKYESWCKANEIADKKGVSVTGKIVQEAVDEIKPKNEPALTSEQLDRMINEDFAQRAILMLNDINVKGYGARDALLSVINHCNKLLDGAVK